MVAPARLDETRVSLRRSGRTADHGSDKVERIKSLVIPPAWRHVRINSYLKAATAPEYSAKDLRTWAGTLLAAIELAELGTADEEIQIKKNVVKAVRNVAEQLGNTPTVCLGSYIHPAVLRVYENGRTLDDFAPRRKRKIRKIQEDFEPEEKALMKLLTES